MWGDMEESEKPPLALRIALWLMLAVSVGMSLVMLWLLVVVVKWLLSNPPGWLS